MGISDETKAKWVKVWNDGTVGIIQAVINAIHRWIDYLQNPVKVLVTVFVAIAVFDLLDGKSAMATAIIGMAREIVGLLIKDLFGGFLLALSPLVKDHGKTMIALLGLSVLGVGIYMKLRQR